MHLHPHPNNCSASRGWEAQRVRERHSPRERDTALGRVAAMMCAHETKPTWKDIATAEAQALPHSDIATFPNGIELKQGRCLYLWVTPGRSSRQFWQSEASPGLQDFSPKQKKKTCQVAGCLRWMLQSQTPLYLRPNKNHTPFSLTLKHSWPQTPVLNFIYSTHRLRVAGQTKAISSLVLRALGGLISPYTVKCR